MLCCIVVSKFSCGFGRYDYKHEPLVSAVGESVEGPMLFTFWQDTVRSKFLSLQQKLC